MPKRAIVTNSNQVLSAGSPIKLATEFPEALEALGTRGSLGAVAREVLGLTEDEAAYIDAIPPTIQEAIRSAIHTSVERDKPVQVSYAPAYDFEVHMWDYGEALTIQVRGPYSTTSPQAEYAAESARRAKSTTTERRSKAKTPRRVKAKSARRRAR